MKRDEPEATSESDAPAETTNPVPALVAAAPAVDAAPPSAIAGPAASIEDVRIRVVDILAVIVSQKLKKQLNDVPLSKSIEDL
jgi:fatty acid synthase subunit alpha